ncbi:MAG: alkaline phosphatase D family protein, partial [Verrucomicrobiota bacterium]|nr:alkaline phosphatase D family protein [Verrucomicrobiota bacterium]
PVLLMTMIMGWAQSKPAKIPKPDFSQYKRIHQKALDLIRTDQVGVAIQYLNKVAQNLPMDAETHYMLAVAYCDLGKIKEAESSVERALELGLHVGRIIGGTHNGLHAIRKRPLMQRLLRENGKYPVHGPMLANLSGTSAVIWLRTAGPSQVSVEANTDPPILFARVEASALAKRENDYVAKVILKGLKPQTTYQYIVSIDGQKNASNNQRFTTFNRVGSAGNFRLAFGGGSGFVPQHEYIWNTIADTKPQALFQLGDNVYIDNTDVMDMHHYCYYRRQSRSEYRALVSGVSVFSIWDDHDFGLNDCSGGPDMETPKWKRSTYEIFRNNWANPNYGGGDKQPGIWWDTYINDIHFICIDGRYYRTNPKKTKGKLSMLGPVQKHWLLNTIKNSKGTFKVLVSPVPWVFKAKGDSKDTWNGFKDERNEIFQFLSKNNIKGVLLMSADRHRSDLWKIDRSDDYSLYEFNSSRLTNQHVHKTMDEAIYSYNAKQSFGTVDFDTQVKDPTVTYAVHSIDGEQIYKFTVKRSQLE